MKPFQTIASRVVPIDIANCDTDQLVPARFLSRKRSDGFGGQMFHDLRYSEGRQRPEFPVNWPELRDAQIMLGGTNFGCGSSRESAVWALVDSGFKVIMAPSFGDIFFGNSFKNGLLAIVIPSSSLAHTLQLARQPAMQFEVDLRAQSVQADGRQLFRFEIDPLRKHMLLNGLDDIALTLSYEKQLTAFEERFAAASPWL